MAANAKKGPEVRSIELGMTKSKVEEIFGDIDDLEVVNGKEWHIYNFKNGSPSKQRAMGHLLMNVMTFGIHEITGTVYEGMRNEDVSLKVYYESDLVEDYILKKS